MPHRHTRRPTHPRRAALLDLLAWLLLPLFELLDDLNSRFTNLLDHIGSWLADQKPDEIAFQAVRLTIAILVAGGLIVALTACGTRPTQPGPTQTATHPAAVKVVQP